MSSQSVARALRIGMVHNGLVTDERVITGLTPVTIGEAGECTFRARVSAAPRFALFDVIDGAFHLNWRDEFAGRITVTNGGTGPVPAGTYNLAELMPHALVRADGSLALRLLPHYKGKVRVGETFFLFHFVPLAEGRRSDTEAEASTLEPPPRADWAATVSFQSDLQRQTYERIRGYLEEQYERFGCHPTQPYFALDRGSARAVIRVDPWQDDAVVRVISWVVTGANVEDPALMRFLLEKNHSTTFGAFGLDPEGDIFFAHTIVGSTCDREELVASVETVLEMADHYDDEIQRRWGGMRALDAVVADEPTHHGEQPLARKFPRIQLAPDGVDNCIRGLPIPVSTVLEMIEAGKTEADICRVFPEIEPADIEQVRAFGAFVEGSADFLMRS